MAEKTPTQQLAEKLLYKPAYVADKDADVKQKAHAFAEGYKKFLDNGKTEREVAAESEQMLKDAGYQQFDPKKTYAPGDKVYFSQLGKAIVASTIGTRSFEDGFRLVIAHTDSPRLDLRPTPLYESDHFSYFKTHYYGGIRKYQWGTMPLAIHGVFSRADGTTVSVNVGEDENDPVFCITDLLPHLSAEQNTRTLKDGIKAEELNILIGSDAVEDEDGNTKYITVYDGKVETTTEEDEEIKTEDSDLYDWEAGEAVDDGTLDAYAVSESTYVTGDSEGTMDEEEFLKAEQKRIVCEFLYWRNKFILNIFFLFFNLFP